MPAYGSGTETHKVDVDGDGRKDTVTMTEIPATGSAYVVTVEDRKGQDRVQHRLWQAGG